MEPPDWMPNSATILIKSIKSPDWKTVLKAHFHQFMTLFDDCLIFKTIQKDKNQDNQF